MCSVSLQWYPYFLNKWRTLSLPQKIAFILNNKSKKLFMVYADIIACEYTFDELNTWIFNTGDMQIIAILLKFANPFQLCDIYYKYNDHHRNKHMICQFILDNYDVVNRFIDINNNLDEFPTEFFCLVQNHHDMSTQMLYCWHHNILQHCFRHDSSHMLTSLDQYPIAKQVTIVEIAVTCNAELPSDLNPHLAFVANLNYVNRHMKPKYAKFEVWSYCPVSPNTNVIDYIATLPIPEPDGYPAHTILSQGSYILSFHPNLNVNDIGQETHTNYTYLAKKYSQQQMIGFVKQQLITDTEDISNSLTKATFPTILEQEPFYTKYICLYYLLNTRMVELEKINLSTIVDLDTTYLLKLKRIKNPTIINKLKSIIDVRDRLASIIPEYRCH